MDLVENRYLGSFGEIGHRRAQLLFTHLALHCELRLLVFQYDEIYFLTQFIPPKLDLHIRLESVGQLQEDEGLIDDSLVDSLPQRTEVPEQSISDPKIVKVDLLGFLQLVAHPSRI